MPRPCGWCPAQPRRNLGLLAPRLTRWSSVFNQVNAPSAGGCVCVLRGWEWGWRFLLKLVNTTLNNRPLAGPAGLRSPSPGPTRCALTQFSQNSTCPDGNETSLLVPRTGATRQNKKIKRAPNPASEDPSTGPRFSSGMGSSRWAPSSAGGPHAAEARVHFKAKDTFLSDFPGLHLLETRGSGFWDPSSF